jgi:hypothetical protein
VRKKRYLDINIVRLTIQSERMTDTYEWPSISYNLQHQSGHDNALSRNQNLQQFSSNAVQRRSEAGDAELARAVPGYA